MATVAEIQQMYNLGRIQEVMDAVWAEVHEERRPGDPNIGRFKVIRAWCHWRRQEWDAAREWLQGAEESGGAELETKRLRAYFAAYRDKDYSVLQRIAEELPDDVGVQNALIIWARDAKEKETLDHATILEILNRFVGQNATVEVANLYHNAARFFLAKARDQSDFGVALSLILIAIDRYGASGNWHHRAAARFWESQIAEALGDKKEALHAAEQSISLWNEALARDPKNKGFQQNRDNAIKRIAELQ